MQPAWKLLLVIVGNCDRYISNAPVDEVEVQVRGPKQENDSSKFSQISSGMGHDP